MMMKMNRRTFLKSSALSALLSGIGIKTARAFIPEHNWENYDFGNGPTVKDRLYQGPFPQYPRGKLFPAVMW